MNNSHVFSQLKITPVLKSLLWINGVIFLSQLMLGPGGNSFLLTWLSNISDWRIILLEPWRLVTYMFLHATSEPMHIIMNMLYLFFWGRLVEQQLGTVNFLLLYLGSGIGGAVFDMFISQLAMPISIIGASGAVYGVMVGFAVLFPELPINLIFLKPIRTKFLVWGLILLDILFLGSQDGVARLVHIGGALSGFIIVRSQRKGYLIPFSFSDLRKWVGSFYKSWSVKPLKNETVEEAVIVGNEEEMASRDELDIILDKVAKYGYDILSEEEKKKLFKLSKKK